MHVLVTYLLCKPEVVHHPERDRPGGIPRPAFSLQCAIAAGSGGEWSAEAGAASLSLRSALPNPRASIIHGHHHHEAFE